MILYFIGICILLSVLWFAFEMWKAPLLRQNPDGSWTTLQKEKKIMDFFKKKNKNK
jgi:hypothetical protein